MSKKQLLLGTVAVVLFAAILASSLYVKKALPQQVVAVEKIRESGNPAVMLTERGTMLGYGDMVVDYRGIPEMQSFGVPVILDVTHSLQQPNQSSGITGGKPQLIGLVSKAGMAVGVDGIFLETHPEPAKSKSDGANMLALDKLEELLETLMKINLALR